MSEYVDKITAHSTLLLMVAVILFFITKLFGTIGTDVYILGTAALGADNIIYLEDSGALFGFIWAICDALIVLFAGLSFAAVCFDESKDIWFRVVSVAALMMIMFGGLAIF